MYIPKPGGMPSIGALTPRHFSTANLPAYSTCVTTERTSLGRVFVGAFYLIPADPTMLWTTLSHQPQNNTKSLSNNSHSTKP